MAIRIVCGQCGKGIQAPDSRANTKAKCPGCGGVVVVPPLEVPPPPPPPAREAFDPDEFLGVNDPKVSAAAKIRGSGCRFCGGEVPRDALKCRHCGEWLSEEMRAEHRRRAEPAANPPAPTRNGGAAVLSFLIPGLGQIFKGEVGRGFGWMIVTAMGYAALIFPGLVVHIFCIIDAAKAKPDER